MARKDSFKLGDEPEEISGYQVPRETTPPEISKTIKRTSKKIGKLDAVKEGGDTLEFTPEELIGILQSRKFIRALTSAARVTRQSGNESTFIVNVTDRKSPLIESVVRGNTDQVDFNDAEPVLTIDKDLHPRRAELLNFHFHPYSDGPIIPSKKDVSTFKYDSALIGIGHVDQSGNIDILLVKPKQPFIAETIASFDTESFDRFDEDSLYDQEEVLRFLEEFGFHAVIISFRRKNSTYELTSEEPLKEMGNTHASITDLRNF